MKELLDPGSFQAPSRLPGVGLTRRTCLSEFSTDGISQDIILTSAFRLHSALSKDTFYVDPEKAC